MVPNQNRQSLCIFAKLMLYYIQKLQHNLGCTMSNNISKYFLEAEASQMGMWHSEDMFN
jgi:hypothetical protein